MGWLSEDPWPLVTAMAIVAAGLLIALKVSQQGKYLLAALGVLALAAVVLVVEHLWVTEPERIEAVVLELGRAVRHSDADAALALMTPDVTLQQGRVTMGRPQIEAVQKFAPNVNPDAVNPARALIRATLQDATFDVLSISRIRAQAGRLSRMGTADFRVLAAGSYQSFNFATGAGGSDWSMGFREVDGQWRIDRITSVRLPPGFRIPGFTGDRGPL